jgi:hypothetical protein
MKGIILLTVVTLVCICSNAQLKVANYSFGKFGTDKYEHFEFWIKDGKRIDVEYRYGKDNKNLKLKYLGKYRVISDSCFKLQFSNNYILYVIPKGLTLKVIDAAAKYNNIFAWEYEGPVNGIGTYCDVCAEGEEEAMKLIQSGYMK